MACGSPSGRQGGGVVDAGQLDAGTICRLQGQACSDGVTCCRGSCLAGICGCVSANAVCQLNSDCCSGLCQSSGRCGCSASGGTPCATDADCCSMLACVGGLCSMPSH